jgi:hypothetical protein
MISMVASKYADDHQADQVDQVNPINDINDLESSVDKGEEVSGGGGGAEVGGSGEGEIVLTPDRFDVLLGRGRTYRYHPGNLRFQSEFVGCENDASSAKRRDWYPLHLFWIFVLRTWTQVFAFPIFTCFLTHKTQVW